MEVKELHHPEAPTAAALSSVAKETAPFPRSFNLLSVRDIALDANCQTLGKRDGLTAAFDMLSEYARHATCAALKEQDMPRDTEEKIQAIWLELHSARLRPQTYALLHQLLEIAGPEENAALAESILDFSGTPENYRSFLRSSYFSHLQAAAASFIEQPFATGFIDESVKMLVRRLWDNDNIFPAFQREELQDFVRSLEALYVSHPEYRDLPDGCCAFGVHYAPNIQLTFCDSPSACLRSLADNAKGYVRLLGNTALHVRMQKSFSLLSAHVAAEPEIPVTFSLAKGENEVGAGLRLGIWLDQDPADDEELAKVQFDLLGDSDALICNIQGSSAAKTKDLLRYFEGFKHNGVDDMPLSPFLSLMDKFSGDKVAFEKEWLRVTGSLRETLGVKSELDACLMASITFLRASGFRMLYGLADDDQTALLRNARGRENRLHYGPRFARFGFSPPTATQRLWSLDLQALPKLCKEQQRSADPLQDYLRAVRGRRNPGNKIDPKSWINAKPSDETVWEILQARVVQPALAIAEQVRQAKS